MMHYKILILVLSISDVSLCRALLYENRIIHIYLDLQRLQWWTEAFVTAIVQSTQRMPYAMRYLARETLVTLRVSSHLYFIFIFTYCSL